MKKSILFLIITIAMTIFSCNRNDEQQANETLSYQDAKTLGKLHNDGLSKISKKILANNTAKSSNINIVRQEVEAMKNPEIISGEFQINFDVENPSLDLLLDNTTNKNLDLFYQDVLFQIDNSNSVKEFNYYCDQKISYINQNFSGEEKFKAEAFLEVCRNSFEYWAPTSIGGLGEGAKVISKIASPTAKVNWKNVIRNDGIGLGCAFIGNSIALAFGPMGGAAYVAGLAWGTISSSAFGGF